MKDKMILIINIPDKKIREDIEVPSDITALELITALNQIYSLKMDPDRLFSYYLKADNPKTLLRGNRTLQAYGLHDGSEIWPWNNN